MTIISKYSVDDVLSLLEDSQSTLKDKLLGEPLTDTQLMMNDLQTPHLRVNSRRLRLAISEMESCLDEVRRLIESDNSPSCTGCRYEPE